MEHTQIDLREDTRAFYQREDRKRRIWNRIIIGAVWLIGIVTISWVCWVAMKGR